MRPAAAFIIKPMRQKLAGLEKFRANVLPNQNVTAVVFAASFLACTHGAHGGRQGGHNNLTHGVHEWISRPQRQAERTATPSFLINLRCAPTVKTGSRSTARRTMVPFWLNFGLRMAVCTAQCLNLEREFHHTASKLCVLGFEPLK
jgi:hypothetical protein